MDVFSYRKLQVYQRSKDFVINVYNLLKQFPREEQYAFCDQLRRSSISILSNIAEGMGRSSLKEQVSKRSNVSIRISDRTWICYY